MTTLRGETLCRGLRENLWLKGTLSLVKGTGRLLLHVLPHDALTALVRRLCCSKCMEGRGILVAGALRPVSKPQLLAARGDWLTEFDLGGAGVEDLCASAATNRMYCLGGIFACTGSEPAVLHGQLIRMGPSTIRRP